MRHIRQGLFLLATLASHILAQNDDLGLEDGYIDINTANFKARIVKNAQVLASLQPTDSDFDFLPYDLLSLRQGNGQYHWGDITYRYREDGDTTWIDGDSAKSRKPVQSVNETTAALAGSNLEATLPSGPLSVIREWVEVSGDLGVRFTIKNSGESAVEIGSLGLPAEFNSIFTGRTAVEMAAHCSLSDPYIGMEAGYIRVSPVAGTGKALVVTPLKGTHTPLEAYRNLEEPFFEKTAYGSQTFEGFYEWQVLTHAWAEKEWANQEPWNPASSKKLDPGKSLQIGVRFSVSDSGVRGLDDTVRKAGIPVAQSIPGYIIPRDLPSQLVLHADSGVTSIEADPSGSLQVRDEGDNHYTIVPSDSAWGRARLTIKYEDERVQTVHYFITKPTPDVLADLGHFLTTKALFNDTSDPFGRAPSVMTYDYEKRSIIDQDSRVWISGLSDEGGAGAYVAAIVKQAILPNAEEVAILEDFIDGVVWGKVQNDDFSVRKSIFFYEPSSVPDFQYDEDIDWSSWTSWNKEQSSDIGRAYNYVHPSAAYWSLYRVARAYPDITKHSWEWYLSQAYGTVMRGMEDDVWYADVGLMGETVFGEILQDLKRENKDTEATAFEKVMKGRAELWDSQDIPYGSEMAWDSTGQEGVGFWLRYFGFEESVTKTVNSVLGYTPSVPHWGWNGNARRYWDFIYGGKLKRIERQIHHYGSGLNSQVLLTAFRDDPSDSYLLRVGYGGSTGPLSNINQDGFPSAAFHSFPDTLKWDGITGDYGMGFLGMALGGGTYIAEDQTLGLVAYGGTLSSEGSTVTVTPRDAIRRRIIIAPLKVTISVDAGAIEKFTFDSKAGSISLTLVQNDKASKASQVVVWVESSSATWGVSAQGAKETRGGWGVPLTSSATVAIELLTG
ncbi:hypothetical protein AK830_g5054 [Neonectria ditissima]|uniref:Alpha-L-rhamnosidase six-hairpin glycosidase domain-containing protein n=1 Tax=Neonectria ditissima TaxID=78410 RepID=A0A0P7BJQ5_9HYPO|nr:hypothetical protein AK830_g5054 [Neonectria ditissima]